ncbi:DMT family transporter [candidate division KSB1 bacterium]|nr:DMT family transporter [candidate division KSB1 bacterium]
MLLSRPGEFAALMTAVFWTITALAFEAAGKRVGSLVVNLLRLLFGFIFLSAYVLLFRGMLLPLDASAENWLWLSLSGVIGLAIGDLLLFRAFIAIGARISMLIMAAVPPITAIIGWALLGEILSLRDITGMIITICGIALVVLERNPGEQQIRFSLPFSGILLALGGALGQAIGLVFSKMGMVDYNAFAGTQIRIIAATISFSIVFSFTKSWGNIPGAFKNKHAIRAIALGAFFGPFLGVAFSLLAVQHTATGVASTIMAIVPVLIIPPAIIFFREKVTVREIFGALLAVGGVGLLFL